ncbi:hypothetical protein [Streptomyces cinereoruber]|uniref:hypothetical protein n=1 Tax=Streptomyces cinereoruber TaxID=67260 RepID=UPI003654498D
MSVRDDQRDMPQGLGVEAGEMAEEDFTNAVFVRAKEPDADIAEGFRLTCEDFRLCASDPLRLMVLMHWRVREADGEPRTAEAIYATMTELGVFGNDEMPVRLNDVIDAVDFLRNQNVVSDVPDGEL